MHCRFSTVLVLLLTATTSAGVHAGDVVRTDSSQRAALSDGSLSLFTGEAVRFAQLDSRRETGAAGAGRSLRRTPASGQPVPSKMSPETAGTSDGGALYSRYGLLSPAGLLSDPADAASGWAASAHSTEVVTGLGPNAVSSGRREDTGNLHEVEISTNLLPGAAASALGWQFGSTVSSLSLSGEVRALSAHGVILPEHGVPGLRSYLGGFASYVQAERASDTVGLLEVPDGLLGAHGQLSAYQLSIGGGYQQRLGRAAIDAFAAADLSGASTGAPSGGASNIRVDADATLGLSSHEALTARAGVRAVYDQPTSWGSLRPELSLSYERELERSDRYSGAARATNGHQRPDFSLAPPGSAERWRLGLGTQLDAAEGVRLFMHYQGEVGEDIVPSSGVVRAGVRARF
ncbi:MAG: autotransporter outer membrane beta-barrel domain-containing protein [Gammaproteobacteria bacterium]|nr:autotransporter outer membrane beta-barrel domain-containing protein [Gammaproteobacteria bacterium]